MIPTDSSGLTRRPFASVCGLDDVDFNEVFFTDVRVPAENLVGPLNGGWRVANGALGHERTMMWMQYADRLHNLVEDFHPVTELDRQRYATLLMDHEALRLLGSAAVAKAARGQDDMTGISVLKVLGSEAERDATEQALSSVGVEGLRHPATTSSYAPYDLDYLSASWIERYFRSFAGTIAGGTSEIQRNIIARGLGLPLG
jgi:alkylation response protein AidB-like acyl-CoA dehydrogenase